MTKIRIALVVGVLAILAAACSSDDTQSSGATADAPTSTTQTTDATPLRHAVSAANSHATDAGMTVLSDGGSAVDAAIAVQTTLGLVEPQSSGIGGGAFMLHYDAETGDVTAYDGREEAPAGVEPDMFLGADDQPMPFVEATGSGLAVGAPGVIAMLEAAHEDHGSLPWADAFAPAIELSESGFVVSARMSDSLGFAEAAGVSDDFATLYAGPNGGLLTEGDTFENVAYAETLQIVADDPEEFYSGDIAAAIVAGADAEPLPGTMTTADLAAYEPRILEPLCIPYKAWEVCSAPPPAGGLAVLSTLGQLESLDLATPGPTAPGWHLYIEASQRAYADRDRYVADDRFVAVPTDELLDPDYLASRAAEIDPSTATEFVEAGVINGYPRAADTTDEPAGTSHFVTSDAEGDVVSVTTSVESIFGSRRVARGFVLNNQMTDFAFEPIDRDYDEPAANAVAPGKRPRSSMSPTLVLDQDSQVRMAIGSPGGPRIIGYVTKTLVGMLDWGLTADEAIDLVNVVGRNDRVTVELERVPEQLIGELRAMGHEVDPIALEGSGIHLIKIDEDGVVSGAADPRREGTVAVGGP